MRIGSGMTLSPLEQRHAALVADRDDGADQVLVHAHASGDAVHDDSESLGGHGVLLAYLWHFEAGGLDERGVGLDFFPDVGVELGRLERPGVGASAAKRSLTSGVFSAFTTFRLQAVDDLLRRLRGGEHADPEVELRAGTPASAVVGTSGRAAARRGEPTASACNCPVRIWPMTGARSGEK
jgi:hypothetical protein